MAKTLTYKEICAAVHEKSLSRGLANGQFRTLPWEASLDYGIRYHPQYVMACPVVNPEEPGSILHYASVDRFIRDIPEPIGVGRFVTKYMEHYADNIKLWTSMLTPRTLYLARTQEEMRWAYSGRNGTRSCMAYSTDHFLSHPAHPVDAYASGDFAIAYIKDAEDKQIAARALCCPERKIYGRIYGDEDRLRECLRRNGYRHGNSSAEWAGLRLLRIPVQQAVELKAYDADVSCVLPYLDIPVSLVLDTDERYLLTVNPNVNRPRNAPYQERISSGGTNGVGGFLKCAKCGTTEGRIRRVAMSTHDYSASFPLCEEHYPAIAQAVIDAGHYASHIEDTDIIGLPLSYAQNYSGYRDINHSLQRAWDAARERIALEAKAKAEREEAKRLREAEVTRLATAAREAEARHAASLAAPIDTGVTIVIAGSDTATR